MNPRERAPSCGGFAGRGEVGELRGQSLSVGPWLRRTRGWWLGRAPGTQTQPTADRLRDLTAELTPRWALQRGAGTRVSSEAGTQRGRDTGLFN